MPDKAWKACERMAASLFGAARFWANAGERCDFEGPRFIGQVKNVKTLSFPALTALAVEAAEYGAARAKWGVVVAKLRAGRGKPTPMLVVMTEAVWRGIHARLEERAATNPFGPGDGGGLGAA